MDRKNSTVIPKFVSAQTQCVSRPINNSRSIEGWVFSLILSACIIDWSSQNLLLYWDISKINYFRDCIWRIFRLSLKMKCGHQVTIVATFHVFYIKVRQSIATLCYCFQFRSVYFESKYISIIVSGEEYISNRISVKWQKLYIYIVVIWEVYQSSWYIVCVCLLSQRHIPILCTLFDAWECVWINNIHKQKNLPFGTKKRYFWSKVLTENMLML